MRSDCIARAAIAESSGKVSPTAVIIDVGSIYGLVRRLFLERAKPSLVVTTPRWSPPAPTTFGQALHLSGVMVRYRTRRCGRMTVRRHDASADANGFLLDGGHSHLNISLRRAPPVSAKAIAAARRRLRTPPPSLGSRPVRRPGSMSICSITDNWPSPRDALWPSSARARKKCRILTRHPEPCSTG